MGAETALYLADKLSFPKPAKRVSYMIGAIGRSLLDLATTVYVNPFIEVSSCLDSSGTTTFINDAL
ncbi:hypothetical protein DID80_01175 [Candidatus Marinamargulisbacteria bacterium SCGC AAA071-K20]|nr:hypothetical protein DID80_01175 [Candidatus Marinamargulisbacteria bacterium SCGC AAA071-K20]